MNLEFIKVYQSDIEKINAIYDILKLNGEHMYNTKGLLHWKTPYSLDAIKEDLIKKHVFVAIDKDKKQVVHTFQLDFLMTYFCNEKNYKNVALLNKFATIPNLAGRGIGSISIAYIEKYCKQLKSDSIFLDVYEKNTDAISFYEKRGYSIVGTKQTKYFIVFVMKKAIQ